jgi:hypothetical protein
MRRLRYLVALVAIGSTLIGVVHAQSGGGGGTPSSAGPVPAEKLTEARAIISRGDRLLETVGNRLTVAAAKPDIVAADCLRDKLNQISTALDIARGHLASLESATVESDQTNSWLTMLTVAKDQLATLEKDANKCVGLDQFETEDGSTTRTTINQTQAGGNLDPNRLPTGATPVIVGTVIPGMNPVSPAR